MHRSILTALLAAAAFAPGQVLAQTLVRDINSVAINPGSTPSGITSVLGGTVAIFQANDGVNGTELWRSDGTVAGTYLLKDIYPGVTGTTPNSSSPFNFTAHSPTTVAFTANDGVNGNELWVTDGTAAGTTLVKDINPGSPGSSAGVLRSAYGYVYFRATDATGSELWRSDLTAAGTVQVKDINTTSASASSSPNNLTAYLGLVYFTATDGVSGTELWKTDGTAAGTAMVLDINTTTASASSGPSFLTPVIGVGLFFAATDGLTGTELWKTDGTPAGTVLVKDIAPGTASGLGLIAVGDAFVSFAGALFFGANDGTTGIELWRSDGTLAGTTILKDINAGGNGVYAQSTSLAVLGTQLLFTADDGSTGWELWSTDGTPLGTSLVKDVSPGLQASTPSRLLTIGSQVFMTAYHPSYGVELWATDGTPGGTQIAKDIFVSTPDSVPSQFCALGSILVFQAVELISGNYELWKSDGTNAGTSLVKDINPPTALTAGANPGGLTAFNGKLYFSANNGVNGNELWVSDGTMAGTQMLLEINPGAPTGFNGPIRIIGNQMFFTATTLAAGQEIWKSDGTAAGTSMIKDVNPGPANGVQGSSQTFAVMNGKLLFAGNDGTNGQELWVTDGTAAGTQMLMDVNPGLPSSSPLNITVCGPYAYCSAYLNASDNELVRTDGTPAGTIVMDLNPGSASSFPSSFAYFAGRTYFAATLAGYGSELWVTDGTFAGSSMLSDIRVGSPSSSPSQFFVFGGKLFFSANDGVTGTELWSTDGTVAGTVLFKDLNPGLTGTTPNSSTPTAYVNANGTMFFRANDSVSGNELWKSDGTPAGTVLVRDILAGTGNGYFGVATVQAGTGTLVLIPGNDGTLAPGAGSEVWKSDGTVTGTVRVADINPGAASSSPGEFTRVDKTVFFTANHASFGIELWSLPLAQIGGALVENFGQGCPGTGSIVPHAGTVGQPTLGNASFALEVTQGLANSGALLFLNVSRTDVNLGNGCFVYPTLPWISFNSQTDAFGRATVGLPVPNLPALVGGDVYWQWAVVDPQGAFQNICSVSDALRTMFGS